MRYRALPACLALLAAACLVPSGLRAQPEAPAKRPPSQERRIAELEKEVEGLKKRSPSSRWRPSPSGWPSATGRYPFPTTDVREAFEREFYQFLDNRGLLTILVKRYGKFLNVVSEEIDRMAMPPDLIYLPSRRATSTPGPSPGPTRGGCGSS